MNFKVIPVHQMYESLITKTNNKFRTNLLLYRRRIISRKNVSDFNKCGMKVINKSLTKYFNDFFPNLLFELKKPWIEK